MSVTNTFYCAICGRQNHDDVTRCSFCCAKGETTVEQRLEEAERMIRHYNYEIAKLQGKLQAYLILDAAGRIQR